MRIGLHPIHPMLVHFPIAFLLGGLASDLAFAWTGDLFWARAALWSVGTGAVTGMVAGLVGTLDLLLVRDIRRFVSTWNHFLVAVMMLGMASANWWMRIGDAAAAVLPWGLYLSAVTALAVAVAGMLGGKLVYEHQIGIAE